MTIPGEDFGGREINRVRPALPVQAMKTYSLRSPADTHRRKATCIEIDCPYYLEGWKSGFDETDPDEKSLAGYIRNFSGRKFTEHRGTKAAVIGGGTVFVIGEGPLTIFAFEAGQMCFNAASHTIALEREPFYIVRNGDWRGSTGGGRVHDNADNWVDDFATHQDQLADRLSEG